MVEKNLTFFFFALHPGPFCVEAVVLLKSYCITPAAPTVHIKHGSRLVTVCSCLRRTATTQGFHLTS